MLESKYIKKILGKFLPNIRLNKKIYVPMTDVAFTLDNIDSLPKFHGDTTSRGIFDPVNLGYNRLRKPSDLNKKPMMMNYQSHNSELHNLDSDQNG